MGTTKAKPRQHDTARPISALHELKGHTHRPWPKRPTGEISEAAPENQCRRPLALAASTNLDDARPPSECAAVHIGRLEPFTRPRRWSCCHNCAAGQIAVLPACEHAELTEIDLFNVDRGTVVVILTIVPRVHEDDSPKPKV